MNFLTWKINLLREDVITNRGKELTYILGSQCKDGIVLVGDRKISGAEYPWEDKIFMDISNLVVGSSGVYALFDKFRGKLLDFIASQAGQPLPIQKFLETIENLTAELNSKYSDRIGRSWFDVLVATRTGRGTFLQHVIKNGLAEPVKTYRAIGSGEPYGAVFLKMLWRPDMTMEQVAELGYFIIRHIEQTKLDDSVGVGDGHPQIWFVPKDIQKQIQRAAPELLEQLQKRAKERLTEFENGVKQLFAASSD